MFKFAAVAEPAAESATGAVRRYRYCFAGGRSADIPADPSASVLVDGRVVSLLALTCAPACAFAIPSPCPVVLIIQPDTSGVGLGRPLVLAGGHRRHAGMRLLPRVVRR